MDALIARPINHYLRTGGFAGFALDRLGGSGPVFGLNLNCTLSSRLELQLDFERRLNSVNTGEVMNLLSGHLIWKKR
jgi:hypothetical protein